MVYIFPEKRGKTVQMEKAMYRKTCQIKELPGIGLYFTGRLNPENRWVKLSDLIPWDEAEAEYAKHFKSHG